VSSVRTVERVLHGQVDDQGIEHEGQASILRELGCRYGQGYYFSRPLPAAAALQVLRQNLPVPAARPAA
jgi:EAL domain-containing protein (putative c-di-GMP-specific phosphodiesterase class I)